jgi:type I restriction enzyme M protein
MHMLAWLSEQGTAAVVVFPGVLYRGGNEGKIRRYMVDHNFVDAIIQLPSNLFFGTPIQTCIMILKKNKPDTSVLFINAERGYGHEGNKNKLREEDIQEIVAWHEAREDVDYTVHRTTYDEVVENDYVLSVGTYVENEDTSEHLTLPEVRERIAACVEREAELRAKIDTILDEVMGS